MFVADLGIDKIVRYSFDKSTGKLGETNPGFVAANPGAGPRHFIFHPSGKSAFLMEELTGAITVYSYDGNGNLKPVQTISGIPTDYKGAVGSADIHVSPDGKFLYSSNRGESNTIAIFSINKDDGKLTLVGHQSTLGQTPRNFTLDPSGNFLLVANQRSNTIVVFKVDKATGKLSALPDQISVQSPVCLKWIPGR